jgi:hypothetical protein
MLNHRATEQRSFTEFFILPFLLIEAYSFERHILSPLAIMLNISILKIEAKDLLIFPFLQQQKQKLILVAQQKLS